MAVNEFGVRFLLHAADLGATYDHPATLGHLSLAGDTADLAEALAACHDESPDVAAEVYRDCAGYVDGFLRYLGAERVDSIDASAYQGATVVHDLNAPIPPALEERFSVVIDGGLLEHVFDFPTAIRNCMRMVRQGGHLILNLPVNNFPGHGFYQFSPELVFRVLAPRYGFRIRDTLVREAHQPWPGWFRVTDPAVLGRRVQFRSKSRLVMHVVAERIGPVPEFNPPPEQSDYSVAWEVSATAPSDPVEGELVATTPPAPARRSASGGASRFGVPQRTISAVKEKTPPGLKRAAVKAKRTVRRRGRPRSKAGYRLRVWMVWAIPPLGSHPRYSAFRPGFEPVREAWTAPARHARRRARHMNEDMPVRFGKP